MRRFRRCSLWPRVTECPRSDRRAGSSSGYEARHAKHLNIMDESRRLRLLSRGQDFFGIGFSALGVENGSVGPDEVDGAFHDKAARLIQLSHLLALVYQQRKRKVVLGAEFLVLTGSLRVDAVDHRVLGLGLVPMVAELAELLGASMGVVTRIENEHDILAAERGERDGSARIIGKGKIGRLRSHRERVGKQPKHYWMATLTVLLEMPFMV